MSFLPPAEFVAKQDRFTWRRRILRDGLLRPVGFNALVKPSITGREHIPAEGPTLLVMNHIGFADPFVVTGAVIQRWVVPMSKIENFKHPIAGPLARLWGVYPVDREKVDRRALEYTLKLLEAGHCVLIAPEGTRQPSMIQVKEGFTYLATKSNAMVVPIGLEHTDKIGGNLKRLRRTPIDIRFGPAFRFKTNGASRVNRETIHQMTTEAMYQLAKLVNAERRGYYADLSQATTETLEFV